MCRPASRGRSSHPVSHAWGQDGWRAVGHEVFQRRVASYHRDHERSRERQVRGIGRWVNGGLLLSLHGPAHPLRSAAKMP
jgi:hypothetical protein